MSLNRMPASEREAFHCPAPGCGVYARQIWRDLMGFRGGTSNLPIDEATVATCAACHASSLWIGGQMVYPLEREGEAPHSDMPSDVLAIYEEARSVAPVSRKSAAGLLRLALQVLVDEMVPGSDSIDRKIGTLVQKGLDPQIQQAMDVLRVVGNESVHPGQIDLEAEDDLLPGLFNLTNVIVEQVVARPKHIGTLFAKLPQSKRDAIAQRDGQSES